MGIGAATAVSLAKKGVTVWAVARNAERLEKLAAEHSRIKTVVADVTLDEDRARLIAATGPVDILVNNAGLGTFGMVEHMGQADVRHLFEVNVLGLIDLTQRVLPEMLERSSGHICNIGSSISYISGPPLTVYGATKFAVHGFSDGLRREVWHRGVGVSLIQPGPVSTGFWDRAISGDRLEVPDKSGAGVPAQWVANAIVKAIRYDNIPGYATVAVPRPLGLGRLLDLPLISYGFDLLSTRRVPSTGGATSVDSGENDADVILLRPDDTSDKPK